MRQPAQSLDREAGSQILDDVVNQITEKLQTGDPFDLEAYVGEYPELEDQLRKLLPGIQMLADLGHSPPDTPSSKDPDTGASSEPVRGTLGDYRIIREVGRGGMGVVYEAEQVSLGRKVALKVLPFAAMLDQKQLQRFQNEARAAASLRHPNIVQVHFVGCERAVHFYAMDYIEGQTLADLIRHLRGLEGPDGEVAQHAGKAVSDLANSLTSGRFASPNACSDPNAPTAAYTHARTPGGTAETKRTPQAAISTERSTKSPAYFRSIAEIGVQVAEALDHAHEHGVVHRDVKPSNVILDNSGKPWVTDFGLARIETDATLTVTGDLLGTVRYMSPEQALAKRIVVDHRTDIYSLGATLYEMLTLQPVFSGQDRQELLRQIAFEEPITPRKLNKAIPEELEIIVLKAMAKNPAERYDTAQELADDLRRFLEDRPIRARRPTLVQRAAKWSRRHKPVVCSAAVSTFLLLVVGLVGLGIGNMIITKERDEKGAALEEKTNALEERDKAYTSAEAERRRAEGNLDLALAALDAVYLDAIGRDKLLGEPVAQPEGAERYESEERLPLTELERELLKRGLDFYDQFAQKNAATPRAAVQTAQACYRVGLLQAALGDHTAAESAYRDAIERFERLTQEDPNNVAYLLQLAEAHNGLAGTLPDWSDAKIAWRDAVVAASRAIEVASTDVNLYARRAHYHYAMRDYEQAQADVATAVRLAPGDVRIAKWAWPILMMAEQSNDFDTAEGMIEAAIQAAPADAQLRGLYADIARRTGRLSLAEERYREALRLAPENVGMLYWRAVCRISAGKRDEAAVDIALADRLWEKSPKPWYPRARAHGAFGDCDAAIQAWDELLKTQPHLKEAYCFKGQIYARQENHPMTVAMLTKAFELGTDGYHLYKRRALAYFHLRQFHEALSDLQTALKLNPTDTSTLGWIPTALVAKCPDQPFRKGLLELAAKAVENSLNPARALNDRTALYLGLGEWEKGQADVEKAIESETANHYIHYQHALLCLSLNEAPKYRDACADMVRKFGETDDPMAANFVAWTCALAPDAIDDYEPVLACATKAIEARPDSDQFLNTLGAILYRAGRHDEAIERLTELDHRRETEDGAVQSSPAYSWYFLAMAHQKAGNAEQAREYLNKANQSTDEEFADKEKPPAWNRQATLELLRKEAEALLGTDEPKSVKNDQKSEGKEK